MRNRSNKKKNTLDDLSLLAPFKARFSNVEDSSLTLAFDNDLKDSFSLNPKVEIDKLVDETPIIEDKMPSFERTITFLNNGQSFNCKEHLFSNYLENVNPLDDKVIYLNALMELNGQVYNTNDMDFLSDLEELNVNHPDTGERVSGIMSFGTIPIKNYSKWNFKDKRRFDYNPTNEKGAIRIYTEDIPENNEFVIVLIDPHHLFAAYPNGYNYNKVKNYEYCISQLLY